MREPVVVGAFPEPFLHGYAGKARPAAIRYAPGQKAGARALARLLRAHSVAPVSDKPPSDANVFYTVSGRPDSRLAARFAEATRLSRRLHVRRQPRPRLRRHPDRYRYRYSVP